MKRIGLMFLCLAVIAPPPAALAQAPRDVDLTSISLEELLTVEVISTASKFPQQVTDAPASVTIVTGEEIRRFGHRTLADVLDSAGGFYTSDDRNYSYSGVRGFAPPGDYNTKILLLVNGHRTNDPIYHNGSIGDYVAVDMDSIERVEIIRGPGSSLYGSNAFLAVLNVVTRTGAGDPGVHASVEAGSLGTRRGAVRFGRVFANGADLFVSASAQGADGQSEISFPEFDDALTGGIARGLDGSKSGRVFASLRLGNAVFTGSYVDRSKDVPTASYGTVFGDPRLHTVDQFGSAGMEYEHNVGGWAATTRLAYNQFAYAGAYPFDYGGPEPDLFMDSAVADWITGELTLVRRVHPRHRLTTGIETQQSIRQRQEGSDTTYGIQNYDSTPTRTWGAYLQDEIRIVPTLTASAGARLDYFGGFGVHVAPRGALIYRPSRATSFKAIHGRAFRAPNAYEMYYFEGQRVRPALEPETIATTEGIWEQYYGSRVRSSVGVFHSRIRDLISQGAEPEADGLLAYYFANRHSGRSQGVEAEVEARWSRNVLTRFSQTLMEARDGDAGARLTNSPRLLSKIGVVLPVATRGDATVGFEGQYLGDRLARSGAQLPGVFLSHVTVRSGTLVPRAEIWVSARNVFDVQYGVAGGEEHVQQSIPQDGRTLRVGATFGF